jgi:hypothetical protein
LSRPGATVPQMVNYDDKTKIDEEYMSLMAELGEGKDDGGPRLLSGPRFSSGGLFDKMSAPRALMGGSFNQPPIPGEEYSGEIYVLLTN